MVRTSSLSIMDSSIVYGPIYPRLFHVFLLITVKCRYNSTASVSATISYSSEKRVCTDTRGFKWKRTYLILMISLTILIIFSITDKTSSSIVWIAWMLDPSVFHRTQKRATQSFFLIDHKAKNTYDNKNLRHRLDFRDDIWQKRKENILIHLRTDFVIQLEKEMMFTKAIILVRRMDVWVEPDVQFRKEESVMTGQGRCIHSEGHNILEWDDHQITYWRDL